MNKEYLYKVLSFLNDIDAERRKQFEEYFRSAPKWLLDSIRVGKADKGTIFIRENAPVDMIYMIGSGVVKAVDYRIYGITFDFMRFDEVYAFGGMEVVMDDNVYRTTMETVTECIIVKIPRDSYAKWLESDIRVLKIEAKNIAGYLLEQGRNGRAYLFLQGADRLALYFVDMYYKYHNEKILHIRETRQNMADASGLSVKTVNRAVKKFGEMGVITKNGSKYTMNEKQCRKLEEMIKNKIER